MGPIPSKYGPDMEDWTNFHLNKTSEKCLDPTQGETNTQELDKSGFSRHFSSDFEQFRSNLKQFQGTPGRLILRIEHP